MGVLSSCLVALLSAHPGAWRAPLRLDLAAWPASCSLRVYAQLALCALPGHHAPSAPSLPCPVSSGLVDAPRSPVPRLAHALSALLCHSRHSDGGNVAPRQAFVTPSYDGASLRTFVFISLSVAERLSTLAGNHLLVAMENVRHPHIAKVKRKSGQVNDSAAHARLLWRSFRSQRRAVFDCCALGAQ